MPVTLPTTLPFTLDAEVIQPVTLERKPSLDLSVTVTDPNGHSTRWGDDSRDPSMIPRGITFSTQRMSGFTTGSLTLSRRIDRDNLDVALLHDVQIVGADGSVAWEGHAGELPRSVDTEHTLTVTLAGHIAELARRKVSPIFVDRDLSQFTGEPSITRRSNLLSTGYLPQGSSSVTPDATGTPALVQQLDRLANTASPQAFAIAESWYDAGDGNAIGQVYLDMTSYDRGAGGVTLAGSWAIERILSTDDDGAVVEGAGGLGGSYAGYYTATGSRRYLLLHVYYAAAVVVDGLWSVTWRKAAVYGDHDLTLVGDTDPKGVLASDVIRWLANRYAPKLDTSGVQQTSTPIGHLAIRDRSTPYDIALRVNAAHLWDLGCWENRTLTYKPVALDDWDWEVRHDEVGNQIGLQGDTIADLANGIEVTFTNVETGRTEILSPEDYDELRDDSIDNPVNQAGEQIWTDYSLSWPATRATALAIGQAALAENNQPKGAGSFSVTGHIRDRQGNWQPVWRVRAGDRIRLTSSMSLSDRPRMIQETSYAHDARTVTIAVDTTLRRLDAVVDRVATALQAAGLQG